MQWIKTSDTNYKCPKCHAEIEVEQGEELPGYCKRCETEFEGERIFYWFTFEDGYRTCCRGFDEIEMAHEVLKHGKLIEQRRA